MQDLKYKIVGKEYSGIEISSFVIENESGQIKSISLNDIVKLIRGDKILNAKCILDTDTGNYVVSINDGLDKLKEMPKNNTSLTVTARLFDNDKCVGYKVCDKNGKNYKLSILKVWELASQGCINNIKAKIINNNKVLISTDDLDISTLPIIKK